MCITPTVLSTLTSCMHWFLICFDFLRTSIKDFHIFIHVLLFSYFEKWMWFFSNIMFYSKKNCTFPYHQFVFRGTPTLAEKDCSYPIVLILITWFVSQGGDRRRKDISRIERRVRDREEKCDGERTVILTLFRNISYHCEVNGVLSFLYVRYCLVKSKIAFPEKV